MHVHVIHLGRRWTRVNNHMDARHCPECGATVHGNHGQHAHQQWHIELAELLESLSQRAGAEPADGPPVPWTAAVDEADEHEAVTG